MSRVLCITGTDTGVGKTVVTAALAAAVRAGGRTVAVYKPTQTGVAPDEDGDEDGDQDGDAATVAALLGLRTTDMGTTAPSTTPDGLLVREGVRLGPPMAPVDAAFLEGGDAAVDALPTLEDHLARVQELARLVDVVLVEGAGGLLVELTAAGSTIADVALALDARLVVVTRPALGTLNHTALTLEAARNRGLDDGALVLGSWPDEPGPLHLANLTRLAEMAGRSGYRWAHGIPERVAEKGPEALQRAARAVTHLVTEPPGVCS